MQQCSSNHHRSTQVHKCWAKLGRQAGRQQNARQKKTADKDDGRGGQQQLPMGRILQHDKYGQVLLLLFDCRCPSLTGVSFYLHSNRSYIALLIDCLGSKRGKCSSSSRSGQKFNRSIDPSHFPPGFFCPLLFPLFCSRTKAL